MPLVGRLTREGYRVGATSRREDKLAQIAALGASACLFDLEQDLPEGLFSGAGTVILTIPPDRQEPGEETYARKMGRLARMLGEEPRAVFLSSTSVYGANQGEAEESLTPYPDTIQGKTVLHAEQELRSVLGNRLTILRLAGLVGPSRHPGRWLAGKTGLPGGNTPVNLVHQDDVIGILLRVLENDAWGDVFNVCADEHPLKNAFYPAMAQAIGAVPPTFREEPPLPSAKVVANQKSKNILTYTYVARISNP
jgi:nucleoside-diphosphate-sugar epimerase